MIHPGVYLHGEMLSNTVISHAVEEVAKADTILVLGMNLNSSLCKDMLPHFTGKDLIVIHKEAHYLDEKATAAYHGAVLKYESPVEISILYLNFFWRFVFFLDNIHILQFTTSQNLFNLRNRLLLFS